MSAITICLGVLGDLTLIQKHRLCKRRSVGYLPVMKAVLAEDGKIIIPHELREDAQLKPGDTLDVQLYKGTLVLRKHQPLTREQCAALLERSRSQPKPTTEDDLAVEQAIQEARAQRR